MSSLNQVTLLGNLGQDPEVKTFADGGKLANLSIATSIRWKDKQTGEKREKTEWHRVVIKSDGIVGVVEQYCRKGSKVLVQGRLETRKWQDQSGNDRYSTEVVVSGFDGKLVLAGGGEGRSGGSSDSSQGSSSSYGGSSGGTSRHGGLDDEIPF